VYRSIELEPGRDPALAGDGGHRRDRRRRAHGPPGLGPIMSRPAGVTAAATDNREALLGRTGSTGSGIAASRSPGCPVLRDYLGLDQETPRPPVSLAARGYSHGLALLADALQLR
jgi:hypothetical protein